MQTTFGVLLKVSRVFSFRLDEQAPLSSAICELEK